MVLKTVRLPRICSKTYVDLVYLKFVGNSPHTPNLAPRLAWYEAQALSALPTMAANRMGKIVGPSKRLATTDRALAEGSYETCGNFDYIPVRRASRP